MWLGEWKDRTDEPFGFKWPKEPVNALGVYFSHNQESANRLNFGEVQELFSCSLLGLNEMIFSQFPYRI